MKSRISSKGQVTVPVEVRERLGLEPGTSVVFVLRDGEVVLRKGGEEDPVDRGYGMLHLDRPVDALLNEIRGPAPKPSRRVRRLARRR